MTDDDNKINNQSTKEGQKFDPSRRRFMKNTGFAIGGVAGGSLLAGLLSNPFKTKETSAPSSTGSKGIASEARMFFTTLQFWSKQPNAFSLKMITDLEP